jgi:hypothetical protein
MCLPEGTTNIISSNAQALITPSECHNTETRRVLKNMQASQNAGSNQHVIILDLMQRTETALCGFNVALIVGGSAAVLIAAKE